MRAENNKIEIREASSLVRSIKIGRRWTKKERGEMQIPIFRIKQKIS